MELVAGARVAGKYELERRIGVGGMGEVWSAVQSPTRKRVALKFLKPGKDEDGSEAEATRKRFLREARAACAVQHPNVVEIHDVLALDDGAPVMVMEFLAGETLEARLVRDGKMALGEIAAVLARVVSAVGAAHALGIVHRDLKPDNVFLAETAGGVDVKVLDFGIAKLTALEGDAAQTGGLTSTGAMLGTPYYMSPEQAFGERDIDHRADVWSLGIILYRAITGVLPTKAENIGQILKIIMMSEIEPIGALAPHLPADVIDLVGKMLSARREDRPASLLDVKVVLERHAGVEVAGFGAPVQRAPAAQAGAARSNAPSIDRSAVTVVAPADDVGERSGVEPSTVARGGRSGVVVAVALVVLAVIGGVFYSRARSAPSADPAVGPPPSAAPAASVPASPDPASSGPAPLDSDSPPSPEAMRPRPGAAESPPPAPPSSPGPQPTGAPGPARARALPPSAAAPAAPAAPAKPEATSVGGVIVAPPQF